MISKFLRIQRVVYNNMGEDTLVGKRERGKFLRIVHVVNNNMREDTLEKNLSSVSNPLNNYCLQSHTTHIVQVTTSMDYPGLEEVRKTGL